jgi:hypothetical protein
MTRKRYPVPVVTALVVLSGIVAAGGFAFSPAARISFPLGTVSCDGGTESVDAATTAIPVDGTENITGTMVNRMAEKMTDLTIQIVSSSPPNTNPPKIVSATVRLPGESTGHTAQVGADNTASVSFGSASLGALESASVIVDVGLADSPASQLNKVLITPSVGRNSMAEVDTYEAYTFSSGSATAANTNLLHGHDGAYCRVHNLFAAGDEAAPIVRFDGTMSFEGGSNSLSSVSLVDPSNNYAAVQGAIATVTSATAFTITGFSLVAGANYGIVVRFASRPSASTSLQLQATFDP